MTCCLYLILCFQKVLGIGHLIEDYLALQLILLGMRKNAFNLDVCGVIRLLHKYSVVCAFLQAWLDQFKGLKD